MWENAASFGAMIVFGEHRYWGKSLIGPAYPADPATPPGAKAGVDYAYLTHEQALADYASLIYTIKHELDCIASPVVAFGGSYGGMLAYCESAAFSALCSACRCASRGRVAPFR